MGFERGAILAVLRNPVLIVEAMRTWFALRRSGGVGAAGSYLAWRRLTAYGDYSTTFGAQDVVNYLTWRREMRIIRRWERGA